jgi:(2Fe-2S) ferredoxin
MQGLPQPAYYMFMCSVERPPQFPKPSCVNASNRDLFQYTAQKMMEKGIMQTVQPVQAGCLNRCNMGPVMLVEPGHHMYVQLDKAKIDRIVDEHLIGGTPIQEYIIPEQMWGEAISPADAAAMMAGR